jgi:hypothetical protein
MQNNTNEQQFNNNQYTNSNSGDKSNMEDFDNQLQLSQLVIKERQKGQVDNSGFWVDNLHINQNNENVKENVTIINSNSNNNRILEKENYGKLINVIFSK